MAAESPMFKIPATPTMPLFQLSPERVNSAKQPPYISQSPSLPEFGKPAFEVALDRSADTSPLRHSRNGSEAMVQGMVARFDNLSVKDYKQRDEILMKRLEMSKELAEMETSRLKEKYIDQEADMKRYREEARKLRRELEDWKERERRAAKSIEVARDEIARSKATHEHAVGIYEKEIRKARKEAFKGSSTLVKIQEELKATRNSSNILRQGLELEKAKASRYEQEAFSSQYKLVGVQEEFTKAAERLKLVEEERDTLKTNLKEEEVARIAAEGRIALPIADDDDEEDLLASPTKSPRKFSPFDIEDKENVTPGKNKLELKSLTESLASERRLRKRAEEQVDFMKMECQFGCCSCRVAESRGRQFIHDNAFARQMSDLRPTQSAPVEDLMETDVRDFRDAGSRQLPELSPPVQDPKKAASRKSDFLISFDSPVKPSHDAMVVDNLSEMAPDDVSETMLPELEEVAIIDSDENQPQAESIVLEDEAVPAQADAEAPSEEIPDEEDTAPQPQTPPPVPQSQLLDIQIPNFKTVTHTTTIPMTFSPFPVRTANRPGSAPTDPSTPRAAILNQPPSTPMTLAHPISSNAVPPSPFTSGAFKADGTLDREAALEQIRARRGRARSVVLGHVTPRKPTVEGVAGRRDISAPTIKRWTKG